MSALKAQAIEMIEDLPEDRMPTLITFISTLTPRQEDNAHKRAAFERLDESSESDGEGEEYHSEGAIIRRYTRGGFEPKAEDERPKRRPKTWQSSDRIDELMRKVEEHRKLDLETRLKMFASLPPLDEEILCRDDTSELTREREERIMALFDDM